jgi:hypothetical protein
MATTAEAGPGVMRDLRRALDTTGVDPDREAERPGEQRELANVRAVEIKGRPGCPPVLRHGAVRSREIVAFADGSFGARGIGGK